MLTAGDIYTLNAARSVLKALEKAAQGEAVRMYVDGEQRTAEGVDQTDLGRVMEAAFAAEGAIFNVLNVTANYGKVTMTEKQLHNRTLEEVPEP